jgi:hypothetical protein
MSKSNFDRPASERSEGPGFEDQAAEPSQVVARLVPTEGYREPRAHLFPSRESLAWFIRRHRDDLVAAGALRIPTGRWLGDPDAFDRFALGLSSKRGCAGVRTSHESAPQGDAARRTA